MKISSLDNLPAAAEAVIEHLAHRPIVAFYGPMGAGKTTLIREIVRQLGSQDEVTSPTFAIVNEYRLSSGEPLYHFDFYRIESLKEAIEIGVEEYFDSGAVCLIEWPERIAQLLPPDALEVIITPQDALTRTLDILV